MPFGSLLAFGNEGAAITSDDGQHCQVIKNLQDSIFEMTTPGAKQPIYSRGSAGIYVSRDGGQSFTLVTQHSYASLTASPDQPNVLYGKLALGVYRSSDGGKTWSQLPAIKGNLQTLVADPSNPNQGVFAYPPETVYSFRGDMQKPPFTGEILSSALLFDEL